MSHPQDATRRGFVKQAALGTVALRTAGSLAQQPAAAANAALTAQPKSNIRIGVGCEAKWLKSKNDDDLRFFKQIGIDYVNIGFGMVKGYQEHGVVTKGDFRDFVKRLDGLGLKIERANTVGTKYLNAHLARPEGQKEIDNLKRIGEMLADAEIPVFGIQACQAILHVQNANYDGKALDENGWVKKQGRGGYGYHEWTIARSKSRKPRPKYKVTSDQLWKGLLNIYRQVMPTVEGSKTVIAMHGNDPPLYSCFGIPQILCRFTDFDRLFSEVPSKHNGITFCVGTRYESGQNIFEGIRHFGQQGRLFHVHFRNVKGTLPTHQGYSEVMVDIGDLDMAQVLRTLDEVGYDGIIDYDHNMQITGDQPLPKQYIAFAVGYMRGLLHSLPERKSGA